MNKSLLKFACVALGLSAGLQAVAYDLVVDGIYYNILKDASKNPTTNLSITFKDTKYASYSGDVVVPETVKTDSVTYTVTEVGKYGFRNSAGMTSISLPKTIKTIQSGAFSKCDGLSKIVVPDSVTEIASLAIQDCPNLKEIILGKSLQKTGTGAFMGDVVLESIVLPESMTEIGGTTFSNCLKLKDVKVPAGVTKIGNNAFQGCLELVNIPVDEANANYASVDGVVFSKDKKTLVIYPAGRTAEEYTVPEGVTTIGFAAFCQRILKVGLTQMSSDSVLRVVNLPQSLEVLGNSALEDLTKLESITIPAGVKSIGNGTLRGCISLKSVVIPDAVTLLDQYAFSGCTSLKDVTIGAAVEKIQSKAFDGCTSIETIVSKAVTPPVCSSSTKLVFSDATYASAKVYVPKESVDAYKAETTIWAAFGDKIAANGSDGVATAKTVGVKAQKVAGGIVLAGAEGASVQVYAINGAQVVAANNYDGSVISLPARGVYIVRAGASTLKVVY